MTISPKPGVSNAREALLAEVLSRGVQLWAEDAVLCLRAPRNALSEELRAALDRDKQAIIALLGDWRKHAPAAFAQQRLWFLDVLEPGLSAYNMHLTWRLRGVLDGDILRRVLNEIARRHESLRTTFVRFDGQPFQVVEAAAGWPLEILDLSHLIGNDAEAETRAAAFIEAPYDLAKGPLMRACLIRLGADDHVLVIGAHHIVSDGWSMRILAREFRALYEAFAAGRASPLEELPLQFADAASQQRRAAGANLERDLAYWKTQLGGPLPVLELPTDHARRAVQRYRGTHAVRVLPEALCARLKELVRDERATLFMGLLAGFNVLLHRYSNQEDIIVGSPIAGRMHEHAQGLIGLFANTLALRSDLSGGPTFRALLRRVRTMTLDAQEHQELPFEKIVDEIAPERHPARHPIFQVVFALQNLPSAAGGIEGLSIEPFPVCVEHSKFDLSLILAERPQGLTANLEYNTDLFDATTAARMLRHFETVLESAVANPDETIGAIAYVPEDERRQILIDWNATRIDYPEDGLVHCLVRDRAIERPGAPAIVHGARTLTYAELNRGANRVARWLRAAHVAPDTPVAVCMERTPELIAALLGILKAGAAYVPLDPAYPAQRLGAILAEARVAHIVTQPHLVAGLPRHPAEILVLDPLDHEPDSAPDAPDVAVAPNHLACVIYTSGSTGVPKGAAIEHGCLLNAIRWHIDTLEVTAEDRIAQLINVTFDAAGGEIWSALAAGACLVIADDAARTAPEPLRDWLVANRITLCLMPAPLAELLMALDWPRNTPLRTMMSGGDRLSRRPPHTLPFTVINVYGPTETTIAATAGVVTPDGDARPPSIGRPIANTRVYLIDAHMQPVPPGVPGEIHIAGRGLARGYLHQPGLTRERFVSDPFDSRSGARLYKTGDWARYLPDGRIAFIGRTDDQVKLRGFRIELGDIECALAAHPGIAEAAIIVEESPHTGKRIAAFISSPRIACRDANAMRVYLAERIPGYMIPARFVFLESLPRTAHGKIDRKALLALEAPPTAVRAAPASATEKTVAEIWAALLDAETLDVHENFFDAGGNSLLSVQLMARINQTFGVDIPLRGIFEHPTIAGLAACIERARDGSTEASPAANAGVSPIVIPLRATGTRVPLFCFAPAGGTAHPYYALMHFLGEDQPVYALQDPSLAFPRKPCASIEEMAACYAEAIRTVQPGGPYCLFGWSFGGLVAFETARLLMQHGASVPLLAVLDTPMRPTETPRAAVRVARSLKTASYLALHAGSGLRSIRDGLFTIFAHAKSTRSVAGRTSLAERLRAAWVDCAWSFLLRRADLAHIVTRESRLMLIRQPSTREFLNISAANLRASRKYQPGQYPGRVVLFRSGQRNDAPPPGWQTRVSGPLETAPTPGDHFSALRNPHVQTLAAELRRLMDAQSH